MNETFDSDQVWRPEGRGFAMGIVQPQGQVVHLTGQVSWNAESQLIGPGDVQAQTHQCFKNIEYLLAEVGGTLKDIISITTYFLHFDDLSKIQEVRGHYFQGTHAPVSTSIRVAGLGHADFLVELTPVAVIPDNRFRPQAGPGKE